jgi:flagellar FlgN protein
MDSIQVLSALERERKLLEDFICLSEEQLVLLENENVEAVNSLLQRRADLMVELTAIESTLGTWIAQIRDDPSVSSSMLRELRSVNDEIVQMANHIVEIDEQTHARLDAIKQRAQTQIQNMNKGARAVHQYAQAYVPPSKFRLSN